MWTLNYLVDRQRGTRSFDAQGLIKSSASGAKPEPMATRVEHGYSSLLSPRQARLNPMQHDGLRVQPRFNSSGRDLLRSKEGRKGGWCHPPSQKLKPLRDILTMRSTECSQIGMLR